MSLISMVSLFVAGSVLLAGPCAATQDLTELDWGDWGDCSRSCGGGTQIRKKVCGAGIDSVTCRYMQSHLARRKLKETRECNTDACQVTGTWGAWSDWQPCSSTCGTSRYQVRTRPCNSDSINFPTGHCEGTGFEWRTCDDLPACPSSNSGSFSEPSYSSEHSSSSNKESSSSSSSSY